MNWNDFFLITKYWLFLILFTNNKRFGKRMNLWELTSENTEIYVRCVKLQNNRRCNHKLHRLLLSSVFYFLNLSEFPTSGYYYLLPNNHLRLDVNTFQLSLTATDVIVLGQAVVKNGLYAFLYLAALLVHGVAEWVYQIHYGSGMVYRTASNSSLISLQSASSGVSPGSIFPPGNSQSPLKSPYPRWVARIFSSWWMMDATTSMVFITRK